MDIPVEDFLRHLLSKESLEEPSDTVPESELVLKLPPWYDDGKYKLGQKFYWDNVFGVMTSMLTGLLAVLSVPSILAVLVHTRRSSSSYTSYKRYLATILHTVAWHKHPLAPGSRAWKSLSAVRSRHLRAGASARRRGLPTVSQRDLALTQFGFMGFAMLKADQLGLSVRDEDGWEGFVHFWRTIGYMIGLQDRYNICRRDADETRLVCRALLTRVFSPCLENVPEPFEHMARSLLDGIWAVSPCVEPRSMMYFTRYLAEVPGYVYTEQERIDFRATLRQKLRQNPGATEVDSRSLLPDLAIEGLPDVPGRTYRPRDYELLDTVPEYRSLPQYARSKLDYLVYSHRYFYTTWLGRLLLNWNMLLSFWLMEHFPFLAFPRFGYKCSFVDIFREAPKDDTVPLSNKEVLKSNEEPPSRPWYQAVLFGREC